MTQSQSDTQDCWQPGPRLRLSRLYHPDISPDHPAFRDLPAKEQHLVTALHKQYERWSHRPYFKRGLSDRLIAALNGYDRAGRLATCMMEASRYSNRNPLARCGLEWFCEFCAYLRGQDILKKYGSAWQQNAWYELVLSLKTGLCLADPNRDDMGYVWEAMKAIVRRLKDQHLAQGYVGWREIKVHDFWPSLVCTPHMHVLLRCDVEPDPAVVAEVVAEIWATWRPRPEYALFSPAGWYLNCLNNTRLRSMPDLFLQAMKSEAHFYELLAYVKHIDLLGPYDRGYRAAQAAGKLEEFHQEVREFFKSLPMETAEYQEWSDKRTGKPGLKLVSCRRFLYGGNCHGSAGHPLGLEEAVRRSPEHQEAIREKVAKAREDEAHRRETDENQSEE